MSKRLITDSRGRAAYCARGRGAGGRFLPDGEERKPATEARRRRRTERDYLRRVVEDFDLDDLAAIVEAIKTDAIGEGADVKVVNAAREWVGKYILGNAKVTLEDVNNQPAIVKRR